MQLNNINICQRLEHSKSEYFEKKTRRNSENEATSTKVKNKVGSKSNSGTSNEHIRNFVDFRILCKASRKYQVFFGTYRKASETNLHTHQQIQGISNGKSMKFHTFPEIWKTYGQCDAFFWKDWKKSGRKSTISWKSKTKLSNRQTYEHSPRNFKTCRTLWKLLEIREIQIHKKTPALRITETFENM